MQLKRTDHRDYKSPLLDILCCVQIPDRLLESEEISSKDYSFGFKNGVLKTLSYKTGWFFRKASFATSLIYRCNRYRIQLPRIGYTQLHKQLEMLSGAIGDLFCFSSFEKVREIVCWKARSLVRSLWLSYIVIEACSDITCSRHDYVARSQLL